MLDSLYHAVAVAIVTAALPVVYAFLKQKGFDLSQDKKNAIDAEAEKAIVYAEEWAARQIAAGAKEVTSAEKLRAALAFIMRRNPKTDPVKAEDAIHAKLPEVRANLAEDSYKVPGLDRE